MISFKQLLNDWFVRQRKTTPLGIRKLRYDTVRLSGHPHHAPVFVSTVMNIQGHRQSTKREAEQSAAELALTELNTPMHHLDNYGYKRIPSNPVLLLVDHENIQKLTNVELMQDVGSVYAYSSRTNRVSQQQLPTFIERIIVDSVQKNACDLKMIMHATLAAWSEPKTMIFFMSHDNLFGTTADLLRADNIAAHQVTTVNEILDILQRVE